MMEMKPKSERLAKGLWWDRSWNLVSGCTPVDESCRNCWGAREAARLAHNPNPKVRAAYEGLTNVAGHWTGQVRFRRDLLELPLHTRKPCVWALWMDLFHPGIAVADCCKAFNRMVLASWHLFLVLTKRPATMRQWDIGGMWPHNVWLGTSASNQDMADARIPELLRCPAALHFVSCEPLLGPIDLNHIGKGLDFVIAGGESGPGARPTHPDWVRSLRDQCVCAGVPFFFKQWGCGRYRTGKWPDHYIDWPREETAGLFAAGRSHVNDEGRRQVNGGHLLDGREWLQWPLKKPQANQSSAFCRGGLYDN